MTDTSLYDTDIVAWADRQAAELRRLEEAGVTNAVDWANVIEEIESVGRSERHAVESLIIDAFTHLLKMHGDPDALSVRDWSREAGSFLGQASRRLTGRMRAGLDLDELWRDAMTRAGRELALSGRSLPDGMPGPCPFGPSELLGRPIDVAALSGRLRADGTDFQCGPRDPNRRSMTATC